MHRKIKSSIVLLCLLVPIAIGTGCRKDKKSPITFSIDAYMPHTDQPVSGIKWKVIETKRKGLFEPSEPTGWTLEGETDANGQAKGEFYPFKNLDYSYEIHFDYSSMDLPLGEYSITKGPTSYALLNRPISGDNDFDVRILPMMTTFTNFKNLNCFDSNDTFKYKRYNLDESPTVTQNVLDSWPWLEGSSLNGCVDSNGSAIERLASHYIFHWEAVRNGILETGVDTFYVEPGVNAVINMHW